jgi:putative NADPH-quinone reductase
MLAALARPEPQSFCSELVRRAAARLQSAGEVRILAWNRTYFRPVMTAPDNVDLPEPVDK